ncbi:hypothetical protein DL764_006216 [Monosporascus ibericus]|uniref:Uncharacterized protein n=1 Tax=Monosporascus ibericus TaxID=155417 RepID=A0A4Q4T5R3_9PEZI|nr:hypothetical protein DL764_006216 [Monosporascus ibericus]
MVSTTRAFALSSSLRAAASRQTPRLVCPAARRGYASAHGGAAKSSDMPWLIGSVAITVPAAAYLLSNRPKKGASAHHGGSETPSGAPISPDDESPAVESSGDSKQQDQDQGDLGEDSGGAKFSQTNSLPDDGNPRAGQTDATGREVPQPSASNASLAVDWDKKKEDHEKYKAASRTGETKMFSSASEAPSKKTMTEDPREDPKKGEGAAAQKGGPGSVN